jgi:hypothetical protein
MRECINCLEEKSEDGFYRKGGRSKGYMSLCIPCFNAATLVRHQAKKQQAVIHLGGKCSRCGYDKCIRALEFHHTDPKIKSGYWSTMRGWSWERLQKELESCILVCANCHREMEALMV